MQQLSDLTRLVRGDLSSLARRSLAALITIDVHARGGCTYAVVRVHRLPFSCLGVNRYHLELIALH